jgi:signal transduction histidine kinase
VAAIARRCVEMLGGVAAARGVTLEMDLPEGELPGEVDDTRMGQAISNLISNAIRFTPPGGVVRVGAHGDASHIRIYVRDSGPGIPEEQLDRVFDRFWQGDRSAGGAGLGLAIVRGVAEAHGGSAGVTSDPGGGSTFFILLPRNRPVGH